jgi:hypothetical protein
MKNPVSWHKQRLAGLVSHRDYLRERLSSLQRDLAITDAEITERGRQIAAAEAKGLAAFDEDRFMKPRKKGTANGTPTD